MAVLTTTFLWRFNALKTVPDVTEQPNLQLQIISGRLVFEDPRTPNAVAFQDAQLEQSH